MSSPHDAPVLSSSPPSIRGISPVRRRDNRENFGQTDLLESNTRPHISATLARSYDPNDPHVRERQRTLDVDMALHLSRARRETIATPTSASYESAPHPEADPPFSHFSAIEQHHIDMARGDRISHLDHDEFNGGPGGIYSPPSATPIDLQMQHLDQTHDPSLLATMGSEYRPIRGEVLASMPGLPVYEANATRSAFAFAHLEAFAAQEKAELGISSPTNTQGSGFQLPYPKPARSGGTDFTISSPGGAPAFDAGLDSPYRSNRQRKLSQSSPVPRYNRKGNRGKMALFENHSGDPNFSFPSRFMGAGQLNAIPSSDNLTANQYSSGGIGGIISPGHDRPYRFSFYSNALSATIHARSLSELPAEGQSFEDLFTGLPPPDRHRDTKGGMPPVSAPVPVSSSHQGLGFVDDTNKRPVAAPPHSAPPSHNNGHLGRPEKGGASNPGPPNSVGDGGELEGNTWWLDVQNPTDEEMKTLSKVLPTQPVDSLNSSIALGVLYPPLDS